MRKATVKPTRVDHGLPDRHSQGAAARRTKPGGDRALFPVIEASSETDETIDQMNDRIAARFPETLKKLGE